MRKILVLATSLVLITCTVHAQCGTKTKFTASKTEFIKSDIVVNTKNESVIFIADKQNVDVNIGDGEDELKGTITDYACNFTDANNGSISFKSEVTDKSGDVRHATFTIDTKNGKTVITLVATEEETKIRLYIDNSEVIQ